MQLTHGGDWEGYRREYGGMPLDFSANVSPLGMPDTVRRAAADALADAWRYPDPLCRQLRDALAACHGVDAGQIVCGAGAADLIFRLVLARRPRRALVTAPTFAEYEQALVLVGCAVEHLTLREETGFVPGQDLLDAVRPGIDMVFLCEPNNPTGRTSPKALLQQVLARCAGCGALLVVDECFNEFLPDPAGHTLTGELSGEHGKNLAVLRAFTKSFAMAGLRLGYVLCGDAALAERLYHCGPPWAVSGPAQAAGVAALQAAPHCLPELRAVIGAERPRLAAALEAMGCKVIPGEANYLLFYHARPDGSPDAGLAARLRTKGVLLRDCSNYLGLGPGWYRTAVRGTEENGELLKRMREVL